MGKVTLAVLRKRSPNLPEAELRKNLRIIRRLEEFGREAKRRANTPRAQRLAKIHWRQHVDSALRVYKRGCDAGNESAFWDAVLFCEGTGEPKPEWLRTALSKYAQDRINGRVPFRKKSGRPSHPPLDIYIFLSVEDWREQRRVFGKKKKSRPFSYAEAFDRVRRELAEGGLGQGVKLNLALGAIRAAHKRGKKILSDRDSYRSSPFLDGIIPSPDKK